MKTKFSIHHGSYDYRDSIIVELQYKDFIGFGETVAIDYYQQDVNRMLEMIDEKRLFIEFLDIEQQPQDFYQQLCIIFGDEPFIICAFDCAFWDLKARMNHTSIREYLGITSSHNVFSNITIGKNEDQLSVDKKLSGSWSIIKWKFSHHNWREMILAITKSGKKIGIDANGGLDVETANSVIQELERVEGLYLEQPFPKGKDDQIENLIKEEIPVFADESIRSLAEITSIISLYDGFVLKLTKFGGITPVKEAAEYLKSQGKLILLGCMTESSVGISNMAELLPLADFADLDGAELIINDPYEGAILLSSGEIKIDSNRKGNGVVKRI